MRRRRRRGRRAEAAQEEYERELLQLRWEVKKLKLEHELWLLEEKYSPDQPRDELGRWTSGGEQSEASGNAGPDSTGSGAQANVIRICMLGSHMFTPTVLATNVGGPITSALMVSH
jgi:hypothetical protein